MNAATIGTGFIVDWFLTAVQESANISCVAMFSRKESSARMLADKYEIDKIYTNLDDMLKDEEINFVYVASPNSLHFEHALKALQAGKNVICEKPFTSTVEEFDHLVKEAQDRHLYLFEAIVTAHMPNYLRMKKELPRLGTIRMVQCNFSQYSSRYDKFLQGETPNVFNPEFSGGALADINIYNLHYVIGFFGKPKTVHYYANKHANGIDTSGVVLMQYDGFQAVCVGCKDTRSECIAQIQGEKGFITMRSETSRCAAYTIQIGRERAEHPSIVQNDVALYYELQDFRDIYKLDDYERCTQLLAYSRTVMEVYEAARRDAGIVFAADRNGL